MSAAKSASKSAAARHTGTRTGTRATGSRTTGSRTTSSRTAARRTSATTKRAGATTRRPRPSGRGEAPKARGERTRQRVAEALLDLLEQGGPAPTARAVAERAGVSVRLVFHHFEDMDALYRRVADLQLARHWHAVREVPSDLALHSKIDRTVRERAKLYEAIGPVRRAAVTLSSRSEAFASAIEDTDRTLRDWITTTFAPELRAAGRGRRELLAAIDAAASWETWDRLRRVGGLSAAAAARVVTRTLEALLGA